MKPVKLLPTYLAGSLAVAIVTVILTTAGIFLVYRGALNELTTASVEANRTILDGRLENYAADLGQALTNQLYPALVAGNDQQVTELLETARRLSGAQLLLMRDEHGEVLYASGDLALAPPPQDDFNGIRDQLLFDHRKVGTDEQGIDLLQIFDVSTLLSNNESLSDEEGVIQLEADRWGLATLLGLALIALLFVSGLAARLAYRQIRVIDGLVRGAQSLAEGDYTASLPATAKDELGDLAKAFEQMRERLLKTTISRDYLDRVLGSMVDAIILTDPAGTITRVNKATMQLLDYPENELLGRDVTSLVVASQRERFGPRERRQRPSETVFITRSGAELPVSYSWAAIEGNEPSLSGAIIAARNISERKIAEQRIRYLARIDALTKVPNRMQFQHLLQRALAKVQRSDEQLALLYLDVDRFKDVNDTFGHSAGDASLETLTHRVGKLLPEDAFMGRLAGDEFGIAVRIQRAQEGKRAWLQSFARKLLREIGQVLLVQGHELYITCSIGIACCPEDADNVPDLIRNADAALYHAKHGGGNRLEFYTQEMNAAAVERLILKSKLRRSYELDELLVNYQPKYALKTGKVSGAEALVRWELSEHGIVLPSQFIPLAEETNLILEIGEWVLNKVCADYAAWRAAGQSPGRISVNLSLKQLGQANFVRRISRIVRRHDIPMDCLEFEITESTLMQDPERTIGILNELAELGLQLAIDDFGTGYSSLSALQQFPIGTLKIDRSFVRDVDTDSDDATIVSTIIDMAKSLQMFVVAEGVESEEQLALLRKLDCDYAQGLLFGDPMSADEFQELLRRQQTGGNVHDALFA